MTNNQNSGEDKLILLRIESVAFLIVWLASYIQLSIFSEALNLKIETQAHYLMRLGIFFDVFIFLFATVQFLRRKSTSFVPGIGWVMYFISTVVGGDLIFLSLSISNTLIVSFVKAIEFLILSCFHFFCMFFAGCLVRNPD